MILEYSALSCISVDKINAPPALARSKGAVGGTQISVELVNGPTAFVPTRAHQVALTHVAHGPSLEGCRHIIFGYRIQP